MTNRKYIFDEPKISSEEIDQFKNFDDVLSRVNSSPTSNAGSTGSGSGIFSGIKVWIIGIAAIATATYFIINTSSKNNSDTSTEIVVNQHQNNSEKLTVAPPIPSHDIEYESFAIQADQSYEIQTQEGSLIRINAESFQEKGQAINDGEITLKFREFHDPVSIFKSGIPMDYDSAGSTRTFESAGMFELLAYRNGKVVSLNKGKTIDVELVTANSGPEFNLYYFDSSLGAWTYLEKGRTKIDQEDLDAVIEESEEISTNVSESTLYPRPVKPGLPKVLSDKYSFLVPFSKTEFPELHEKCLFQIDEELCEFKPIYYDVEWDEIKLKKSDFKDRYTLFLVRDNEEIVLEAYPALPKEAYETAWKEYNKKLVDYQVYQIELEKENAERQAIIEQQRRERLARLNAMDGEFMKLNSTNSTTINTRKLARNGGNLIRRVATIASLGIFNFDCPKHLVKLVPAAAVVVPNFINAVRKKISIQKLYNSVIGVNTLIQSDGSTLTFSKRKRNVVWFVNEDFSISIVEQAEKFSDIETTQYTFKVKRYNTEEGLLQLDRLINI